MVKPFGPSRPDRSRETTLVLFFRPDRPRAIDRIIRYFGDAPIPTRVPVRRPGSRRPGTR